MDKKQLHPTTKDAALQRLGVRSAKHRRILAGQLEFVGVTPGRQLIARGRLSPSVVIAVTGSALVTDHDGHVVHIPAPFFIDTWALDARRIAEYTVAVDVATSLILVDWRYRDSVVSAIPALNALSKQTYDDVNSAPREVIDLTDNALTTSQPTHQQPQRRSYVHT